MALDVRLKLDGFVAQTAGLARAVGRPGKTPLPAVLWRLLPTDATTGANGAAAVKAFTVAAGGAWSFDVLSGEADFAGGAVAWAKVTSLLVLVASPAAATAVRLGPDGRANAAQLWFPATASGNRVEVRDLFWQADRATGWAVSGGNGKVWLSNAGAASVSGTIVLTGVKS